MCDYIKTVALYTVSMIVSFFFTGFLMKPLSLKELKDDEEEEKKAIKRLEEENFEYKYLDEYELLEDKEVDLDNLKDKETKFEIPFLKVTIIMFYEDNTFKYFSNTDVIYKYLNVVCRKFVIDHDVKKLYVHGITEEIKKESVKSELFVTRAETTLLETKINHFVRAGTIYDYNDKKNIKLVKEIDILDFLKTCK